MEKLINNCCKSIKIKEINEPIDFDHPFFYLFFGFIASSISTIFIRLIAGLNSSNLEIIYLSVLFYNLIISVFIILTKPVSKRFGQITQTAKKMTEGVTNSGVYESPSSYLHYILSGPKAWFWEYAFSPHSFFGDLVSKKAIGKMGGAGTFLLIDLEYDLIIAYLTNYGQPERTLEGEGEHRGQASQVHKK